MSRSGVPSEFSTGSFTGFLAAELLFDSGALRLWNGYGDLTISSNTYTGGGALINVSAIEETAEIGAKGASMMLTGVSSSILSTALSENYQYRVANIYVGAITSGTVSSYKVFSGRMDVMTVTEDGGSCTVAMTAESRLIDLERPRLRRWTSEDQKGLDANDKGFEFVNSLQEASIKWGG
tara:strand:+ start:1061 stop:1600 length:540 start_codon:yes stop_codon:yes gene_type:complete